MWHLQLQATALQFAAIIFASAYTFAPRAERIGIIIHCAPAPLHAVHHGRTRAILIARRRNAWIIMENESNFSGEATRSDFTSLVQDANDRVPKDLVGHLKEHVNSLP